MHSMSCEILVLDGGSQSMPAKHLVPRHVKLHQKLHLQSWIFRAQRNSVQSVCYRDVYLGSRQHSLSDMSAWRLLPACHCYSHSVCVGRILPCWFVGAEYVPCRVVLSHEFINFSLFAGKLLPRRNHSSDSVSRWLLLRCWGVGGNAV